MAATELSTRTAHRAELNTVIDLCLAAFADEAVTAWVIPEPTERHYHMREMFGESLDVVVSNQNLILAIDVDGEPLAASIWLPHMATSETPEPHQSEVADDPATRRMIAAEAATQLRRPTSPHLYLASMATLPDHRGRGAGAAMLAAGMERAQALSLPIYLEASTSDNRRLYERGGFRDLGDSIQLPDGGPILQPMWRDV